MIENPYALINTKLEDAGHFASFAVFGVETKGREWFFTVAVNGVNLKVEYFGKQQIICVSRFRWLCKTNTEFFSATDKNEVQTIIEYILNH